MNLQRTTKDGVRRSCRADPSAGCAAVPRERRHHRHAGPRDPDQGKVASRSQLLASGGAFRTGRQPRLTWQLLERPTTPSVWSRGVSPPCRSLNSVTVGFAPTKILRQEIAAPFPTLCKFFELALHSVIGVDDEEGPVTPVPPIPGPGTAGQFAHPVDDFLAVPALATRVVVINDGRSPVGESLCLMHWYTLRAWLSCRTEIFFTGQTVVGIGKH